MSETGSPIPPENDTAPLNSEQLTLNKNLLNQALEKLPGLNFLGFQFEVAGNMEEVNDLHTKMMLVLHPPGANEDFDPEAHPVNMNENPVYLSVGLEAGPLCISRTCLEPSDSRLREDNIFKIEQHDNEEILVLPKQSESGEERHVPRSQIASLSGVSRTAYSTERYPLKIDDQIIDTDLVYQVTTLLRLAMCAEAGKTTIMTTARVENEHGKVSSASKLQEMANEMGLEMQDYGRLGRSIQTNMYLIKIDPEKFWVNAEQLVEKLKSAVENRD